MKCEVPTPDRGRSSGAAGRASPASMMRAPSSGSPARRSSSISDTRGSEAIFWVCNASAETRRSGAPSASGATLTSEQYGAPLPVISVASAPWRLDRSSPRTIPAESVDDDGFMALESFLKLKDFFRANGGSFRGLAHYMSKIRLICPGWGTRSHFSPALHCS